ncbi:MAG TPA: DUF2298 domain-containing protein, partial [Thermoanaerobaculia bacterium]|nr:DUF2298 domain-containing protein [Thermoanaerobaculia bacterium]
RPSLDSRERRATEAVFWGVFVFFLAARAIRPEIYWGEKPMDFAFLNSLYRAESLPPPEPWFAGAPLRYTYFGHFGAAAFGKALGIHPALMFNLALAATAALTAAALFAAGAALSRRWQAGVLAVLLGLVAGNLSGIVEVVARRAIDFDTFWATSRVVPNTINEFPFWSFLFADLHAHVLVMPYTAGFVALLLLYLESRRPVALFLLALFLAAIAMTSGWSLPVHLVVLAVCLWVGKRGGFWRGFVLPASAVSVGAFVLSLPFWRQSWPGRTNWGWERGPHATVWQVVTIFGLFLVILVPYLVWCARRRFARRRRAPRDVFPLAFATVGLVLIAACEVVFLWDRMNTLFKYYLEAWLLLSLASSAVLCDSMRRRFGRRSPASLWRGLLAVALSLALFTSAIDVYGALRTSRVGGPSLTLDGMAYLGKHAPFDAAAVEWIERNIPGLPTLCEAQGPPYQEFSRISMNTGLPALLGWDYHVYQRGRTWGEIERRKKDVATIYTAGDKAAVAEVLRRDRVGLVYVGPLERETYGAAGVAKLAKWTERLSPIYQNPGVTLFAVKGASFEAAAPFVETIPGVNEEGLGGETPRAQEPAGHLKEPRSLAIDGAGSVFVADFGNDRIQKLDSSFGSLATWGRHGKARGEFDQPCGVALGPSGSVYVADTWNGRVQ